LLVDLSGATTLCRLLGALARAAKKRAVGSGAPPQLARVLTSAWIDPLLVDRIARWMLEVDGSGLP
jgi:hypothetical protein